MHHDSHSLLARKFPVVTAVLLVGCLVSFVFELCLGSRLAEFLLRFGVVPVGLVSYFNRVPGATFPSSVLPFFSSLILHGGFLHLLLNVSYLWVVGDFVEDWLGRTRFVALVLFGAATELVVRIGLSPSPSGLASVGMSGAVASLIGAFLIVLVRLRRSHEADSHVSFLAYVPVLLALLAWFPAQLLNRRLAIARTAQTYEPVSWLALAAALVLGMFLLSLTGRRIAATPAVAPAFPKEEAAPVLGA